MPPDPETLKLLTEIRDWNRTNAWLNLPDNRESTVRTTTGGVNAVKAGQSYKYAFPKWTRRWVLQNFSEGAGQAGYLYYWKKGDKAGLSSLPSDPDWYGTLQAGDNISSNVLGKFLFVMADATVTDQAWEIRFTGRVQGDYTLNGLPVEE